MDFNKLADTQSVEKTIKALQGKGYEAVVVQNKEEALSKIKKYIPENASVMNGSSVTLEQIGYLDFLQSKQHTWIDLHAKVQAENNPATRSELRRKSVLSEYYLGSVHALVENGEFLVASNTASQLPHVVYTSPNLIFIVSAKKIVPTLNDAFKRLEEHVYPLEDKHMKDLYGSGTNLSKIVVFKAESSYSKRKIRFILVEENLGF